MEFRRGRALFGFTSEQDAGNFLSGMCGIQGQGFLGEGLLADRAASLANKRLVPLSVLLLVCGVIVTPDDS